MSIQYMVLGIEPTTFKTQVSSRHHYTRADKTSPKEVGVCPNFKIKYRLMKLSHSFVATTTEAM